MFKMFKVNFIYIMKEVLSIKKWMKKYTLEKYCKGNCVPKVFEVLYVYIDSNKYYLL